jgi:subtilisin family serine protease
MVRLRVARTGQMGVTVNKKIIGWTLASLTAFTLLLAGLYSIGSTDAERNIALSNGQARSVPAPVLEVETPLTASVTTNGGSLEVSTGAVVLEERQAMQANGTVERRRLVRRAGKHPNRLTIETLQRDHQLNRFVSGGTTEMVADHILVHLQDHVSVDALNELAEKHGASILRGLSDERTFIVQLQSATLDGVEEAVGQFTEAAAEVAYAEPDYVRYFSAVPNDTMYGDLWGMPKISAPTAWDITVGDEDVVVAVIDTGMDMDHPDLVGNLWMNSGEIAGDGLDNDGNGYVDDVNGWSFVEDSNAPEDDHGHGTHCAGTVGAVGNNANQVVGVCWEVSIMPVRAGTGTGLLDSDIVDSIRYAAGNGAKVLSNSYGGTGFSQTIYDAVSYANDQGAVFVAAAGNDASNNDLLPQYPASYDLPNVISVAATDSGDSLASFSNFGATSVDLAAPGEGIVSTYLNGSTATLAGTSMACPHVSGALALLVSIDPGVDPSEARQILLSSVDPVASLNGKVLTGGRLNAHAMFANANDTDGDGMTDTWETLYGLNPNDPSDADIDIDGDFLSNLLEFQNGTVPTNSDTDGDSLIDGWEIQYGFNPLDVHGKLPRLQYLGFNDDCLDPHDVVVQGNYAYVADGAFGFKVLDLATPEDPQLVGSYSTSGTAQGVDVAGATAYVADSVDGLVALDVSDPATPQVLGSTLVTAMKVDVQGSYAYVAALTNGVKIVSVANPASMSTVYTFAPIGIEAYDVEINGSTLYIGVDGAVARLNVSNPASPSYLNDHINGNDGKGLHVANNSLYAANSPFGATVYNLSLGGLGEHATPGSSEDIFYNEGLVYVADGIKGLRIFEETAPGTINPYTHYQNIMAYGVTVTNGYAYVAGKTSGLHIFRSSVDSDSDGMYDGWEMVHFGSLAEGAFDDFDSDGIFNWGEFLVNLIPTDNDQDADTLIDGFDEVQTYLTDPRTPDTDGDGLTDDYEVTTDGVDNLYLTSPLLADTDGDGMNDKWEIDHGLNPLVDDADLDPDNDGATNLEEHNAGTDPSDWDTDDDGMPDGWEIDNNLDPHTDDAADDADGDNTVAGLDTSNLGEYLWVSNGLPGILQQSTDPNEADTDNDWLGDNWEMIADSRIATNFNGGLITNIYLTDPNLVDTDGDGMPDGWEEHFYISPVSTNGNDGANGDMDGDGLTNYEEYLNGSDPFNDDTDNDGFTDDWERDWGTMATNAADPLVVDDDGPFDWWMYGGQPQDPTLSDPDEDGSKAHPFDAIQEAINVASNGFTVLVKEGQYYGFGNRDINLGMLNLRILAENQTNVAATVIKSHGLSAVIVFDGGQTTNTVLAGVTVQSSMVGIDCSNGDCGEEHGIICKDASSPLITNCVVEICRDDAIYCEFNSSPIISNVTVRTIYEGHGIYAQTGSSPKILDSTIEDISSGCGIRIDGSAGLEVRGCTINDVGNSIGAGRGIWITDDSTASIFNTVITDCQGGIRCDNSSPTIDRCTISGNAAPDYYESNGVGYYVTTNIAVWAQNPDNQATDLSNMEENGGGILLTSGSFPEIQNCVITSNRTWAIDPDYPETEVKPYYGLGGGIYAGANCATRLINNTLAANTAMTLGGGFTTFGNFVEHMRNDILWGNFCWAAWLDTDVDPAVLVAPGNVFFNSLHCNEGTSHFDPWYCDISDGFGFVVDRYNFESDPLFTGGSDYHITSNSPCIDVGTYFEAPGYDRDGVPRPLDGDGNSNTYYSVDVGAYEFIHPLADTDGDGQLDQDEINNGTNPIMIDSDFDGMTDGFEALYGLNGMLNDALGDLDNDGVSNLAEANGGTDPTNSDTDGDNSPDGDEAIAGTDPLNAASYFYVSDIQPLIGGGCQVTFDSVVGRTYSLYCCSEPGGFWILVQGGITGTGLPITVQDLANEDKCFYKVEVGF